MDKIKIVVNIHYFSIISFGDKTANQVVVMLSMVSFQAQTIFGCAEVRMRHLYDV